MRHSILHRSFLCLAFSTLFLGQVASGQTNLPPMKKQSSAKAVVDEHLDAINRCDWTRLMAQYPANVEFFLPGGEVVKGREQVGRLFHEITKPFKDGGICGVKFEVEHVFTVGDTINVQWRAVGDMLAEPYRGADAYVTKDGMMWAQVTTFDRSQVKAR
jgi:hypothetical protein